MPAAELLPDDLTDEQPYVALDTVHLARWRGHALARFGHPDAIKVLTHALNRLDRSFVRAEATLHIDLATALAASGNQDEASEHARRAHTLAAELGSTRQRRRLQTLRIPEHGPREATGRRLLLRSVGSPTFWTNRARMSPLIGIFGQGICESASHRHTREALPR